MRSSILAVLLLCLAGSLHAQQIQQNLGVDQRIEYKTLTKFGPWDDRNYQLTKEDLDLIPEKDQYLANVPVFFKVTMRREIPALGEFYPRSTYQLFQIRHGGLLQHGVWKKTPRGAAWHPGDDPYGKGSDPVSRGGDPLVPEVEFTLDSGLNGNEVSVEFNPTNPMIGVAGSNRSGGQTMYYTTDGGLTWTRSQVNPSSCCDPTIDWSSDGSIVYQAELSSSIGVRWAVSTDQGVTWGPMQTLTPSGSDKEFIHVDRSLTSPHVDNVYLTYHNGNVMQFARSTDMGATFDTPLAFPGDPTGIGSDITTGANGNIYYMYASLSSATGIRLLKSTDGGATFAPSTLVATLNGRFDFPIPSMESREAFIYVSADVDMSGGPNEGRIYATWTDETDDSFGGGNGSAAQNHGWIEVYYSDDEGVSWTRMPHPHDTSDSLGSNPVDRYHPWLKVGENGVVHIGFYDTRNSANRTGIDFYYNASIDGETWQGEQRFSTETSVNINNGQEWGDYNGLSVVLDRLAMTWTDNRPSNGQAAIAGAVTNPNSEPTFLAGGSTTDDLLCDGDTNNSFDIAINSVLGFNDPVTLSVMSAPPISSNEAFTVNPVVPTGTSVFSFDVSGGTSGDYTTTIEAASMGIGIFADGFEDGGMGGPGGNVVRTIDLAYRYNTAAPGTATLTAPADAATNVDSASIMFDWSSLPEGREYTLEVATDAGFTSIVSSTTHESNTATLESVLDSNTQYFWRVRASNGCGTGGDSATFSFTTAPLPGDCPAGSAELPVASYNFEAGAEGWTSGTNVGANTWALSSANPQAGGSTQHWHVDDQSTTSDTFLTSPTVSLPTGAAPLTFQFWNMQQLESRTGGGCWDAGILEISVDGGAFLQVDNALLLTDPYDGEINAGPLDGAQGWCGDPQQYLNSVVDIDAMAGSDVQFRFRVSTDGSVGRPGWDIDEISVSGCQTVR